MTTQTDLVLQALKSWRWHSVYELEAISGSRRISARIWDLTKAGYVIERRYKKFPTYEYRLVGQ